MPPVDAEAERVAALLKGDEAAYVRLVQRHHHAMLRLARAIIGDGVAEEVVQESWLKIIVALPGFERRSQFGTWMLRITANYAKSRLRHEQRQVSVTADDDLFDQCGGWRETPRPDAFAPRHRCVSTRVES